MNNKRNKANYYYYNEYYRENYKKNYKSIKFEKQINKIQLFYLIFKTMK